MPDGAAPNLLQDLWELAKTAGPFGTVLMIYLWLRCDKERREKIVECSSLHKEYQDRIYKIYEDRLLNSAESGRALAAATNASGAVAAALENLSDRIDRMSEGAHGR